MKEWTPEKIRELRTGLKLYQTAFGALIGVTGRYVSMLEQGVKKPSKTLKALFDCMEREHGGEKKTRKGAQ